MKYVFKMMAVILTLFMPYKFVLADNLVLDCKTIKTNTESIIKNNNSCGVLKPNSCYEMEIIIFSKYNSLEYQIYAEGNLFKSYLLVLEEINDELKRSLISHMIIPGTKRINSFVKLDNFYQKSLLTDNENCNFLELLKENISSRSTLFYDDILYENIPEWCLKTPISEKSIIQCGMGSSKNKYIAKDLALLDAKYQIADIFSSAQDLIECENLDNVKSRIRISKFNDGRIKTSESVMASEISDIRPLKSETELVNNRYFHYELIEYLIPGQKKSSQKEIKDCQILQKASDKAMKELEAEIENRKNK